MTRDEAVQKAEAQFDLADRALNGDQAANVETVNAAIALGNGYLALARLADG